MNNQKPQISFVVPAYNEEQCLPQTLQCLQELTDEFQLNAELIVVDNNSTDGTAELAREMKATVVFEPVNQIARARNAGARSAKGEWLIFVDADTRIRSELLRQVLSEIEKGQMIAGGALVEPEKRTTWLNDFLFRLWNRISVCLKWMAGCFVICRHDVFEEVGGFDEKLYATEEINFALKCHRVASQRQQTVHIFEDPKVVTSSRKSEWYGDLMMVLRLVMALIPGAVRFKIFCGIWYSRPVQH